MWNNRRVENPGPDVRHEADGHGWDCQENGGGETSITTWRVVPCCSNPVWVMWVKQCHTPPMTVNGCCSTFKNCDDWGMVQMTLFLPTLIWLLQGVVEFHDDIWKSRSILFWRITAPIVEPRAPQKVRTFDPWFKSFLGHGWNSLN